MALYIQIMFYDRKQTTMSVNIKTQIWKPENEDTKLHQKKILLAKDKNVVCLDF